MSLDWQEIKKQINKTMMDFGYRVYVSIADILGNAKVQDEEIEPFMGIITPSIQMNLKYLGVGDYSIPISSKNLMIFRVSKKGVVILFSNKGNVAQLLSFKKNIDRFGEKIDDLLQDLEYEEEETKVLGEIEKRQVKKIESKQILGTELPTFRPKIDQELDKKAKFTVEEMQILRMCDGTNSLSFIAYELKQPEDFVADYLQKQVKKKRVFPKSDLVNILCPICSTPHYLFIVSSLFEKDRDLVKILIRSEKCSHEFVAMINKKLKVETQSFQYFTPFQQDKFMKRLGEHFYIIIS